MKPAVSIIIPIHNEREHLQECVQSVLIQSFKNFEILISDNLSTDGSLEIAMNLANLDERVQVHRQAKMLTIAENFKFLIDQAQAPYTFVLGGHDLLTPNCIEDCYTQIQDKNFVCVYPLVKFFGKANKQQNPNSNIAEVSIDKTQRFLKIIRNLRYGSAVYSLYKTDVLQRVEFKSFLGADLSWLVQVANQGSISSSGILGYMRREDRIENAKVKKKRYLNYVGLKSKDYSFYPVIRYIINLMKNEEDISDTDFQNIIKALINKYQKSSLINPGFVLEISQTHNLSLRSIFTNYLVHVPKMIVYSIARLFK